MDITKSESMEKTHPAIFYIRLVAAVIDAALISVSIIQAFTEFVVSDIFSNIKLFGLFVGFLIVILVWWIIELEIRFRLWNDARPLISIHHQEVISSQAYLLNDEYKKLLLAASGPIPRAAVMEYGQPFDIEYVCIFLENKPKIHNEHSYARGVIARVSFRDISGKVCGDEYFGRWADIQAPHTLTANQSIRDLLKADIESSGLPKRLNIAVKIQGNKTVHGFGFLNNYEDTGFDCPRLAFDDSRYHVHLKLSGDNIDDQEYEFIFYNRKGKLSINLGAEHRLQRTGFPRGVKKAVRKQLTRRAKSSPKNARR